MQPSSGHGSGQELTYLLNDLVDLHPDLVIALDGWNDYYRRFEASDERLLGTNGFDQTEDQLVTLAGSKDSSLHKRLRNLPWLVFPRISYRANYSRIGRWAGWLDQEAVSLPSIALAATRYVENLTKMHKMGTAFDYRLLVAIQPDVDHGKDYQRFREKAASDLSGKGIPVLDLGARKEFVPAMFLDRMYLNAEGHRTMADIIAQTVRAERLLMKGR